MSNTYTEAEYTSVSVSVTAAEARSGCFRTLRYPGAPEPLLVELPEGLKTGAVLYVDAPFFVNYGDIEVRPLRIDVTVQKPRRGYGAAAALLFVASAALIVILVTFARDARRTPTVTATPAPVQASVSLAPTPTPEPTPEPLSAVQQEARALIPHFELREYLLQLDDRLLENFCALYRSVSTFESGCSFTQPLSKDELSNLTLLLSYECPELLQFSASEEITYYSDSGGNVVSARLPITLSQEQYAAEFGVCDGIAKTLAQQTAEQSDYERELAAYNYIASNCYYSYDAVNAANAYGALGDGAAKCDGISLAMKWICEEMGIPCMVMAGNQPGNPIGHAWNIVRIDGTYYDLDVTNDVNSAERNYNYYGAFNVSRSWMRSKYTESVSFAGFLIVPGSESMNMSYHALHGTYIPAGDEYIGILFDQLDAISSADDAAYLQFESWDDYAEFIDQINSIMGRWGGLSRGSFNYSLSHLDEFQVCRITVSFI